MATVELRRAHVPGRFGACSARRAVGRDYDRVVTPRILIARAEHKFSCAHMTVFADGTKERLHGHNYTVAVALEVERIDLAAMIPFAPIKAALAELCRGWKEHVLLAAHNPHFTVIRDDGELEFTLCGERYVMPRQDALLLPIDNISVEALAAHVAGVLRDQIAALEVPQASALEVTIEESPGQGASCMLALR
jgi:6-pyruvoyltetrahydropterin/6-carboxytetrahydropterin synthase